MGGADMESILKDMYHGRLQIQENMKLPEVYNERRQALVDAQEALKDAESQLEKLGEKKTGLEKEQADLEAAISAETDETAWHCKNAAESVRFRYS